MARRTGHGGLRQGTPGRQYGNRTDLNAVRAPAGGIQTPAAGGITPPPSEQPPGPQQLTGPTPDQITPMDAPTDRPNEPVTAGLPFGPGPGANAVPNRNRDDLLAMGRHLPWLYAAAQHPDTPVSVINFLNYLQSQVNSQ